MNMPMLLIIREPATDEQVRREKRWYADQVGCRCGTPYPGWRRELHADCERALLEDGVDREHLGADWYPPRGK
jgi:hypothetical protein